MLWALCLVICSADVNLNYCIALSFHIGMLNIDRLNIKADMLQECSKRYDALIQFVKNVRNA